MSPETVVTSPTVWRMGTARSTVLATVVSIGMLAFGCSAGQPSSTPSGTPSGSTTGPTVTASGNNAGPEPAAAAARAESRLRVPPTLQA